MRRATPALLAARDLTIAYGKVAAVREVALEIREGEVVTIVGPNGAGKTTLLAGLMGLLPGVQKIKKQIAEANLDDKQFRRQEAIISSMTKLERKKPDVLNASRKRRVAKGAGVEVMEINRLLKQHRQMADVFKSMSRDGGKSLARMAAQMGGGGMGADMARMKAMGGGRLPEQPGQLPGLGGGAPVGGAPGQLPGLPGQLPGQLPGLAGLNPFKKP